MIIGSRQRLHAQCGAIDISIDDKMIKRVDHTKSLGVSIAAQFSWSKHVDEICRKASSAIGALKCVRPFIPTLVDSDTIYLLSKCYVIKLCKEYVLGI